MMEKTASSTNAAGKTGYPHVEDWNKIPVFHPIPIKLWIKDLNIRPESLK
jgi:hypothetical protein